jgi:GH15 family glucan-1,4-alpha-glucosidase
MEPRTLATTAPRPDVSAIVDTVASRWREPDEGIWEIRGERRHFTYSKMSAWFAVDRAIRLEEAHPTGAPMDRWRRLRDEIHADVCANGYDPNLNSFVQYYGGKTLDASLLLVVGTGFLPPTDPRITGTIDAIQRELCSGPFVQRYSTGDGVDGLAGSEGTFLICAFWLVNALALAGRMDEARANLDQLLLLQNDVGLLSEEYDPVAKRFLGNFPQAFSHVGLLHSMQVLQRVQADQGRSRVDAGPHRKA